MTLHECKNGLNVNKVRFFGTDQLSPSCNESWDRVKIVCTQPYIKQAKFGLSFIAFHSKDLLQKESVKEKPLSQSIKLGSFTLRSEDDDNDDVPSTGRLFAKRHEKKEIVRMPESPLNRLLATHKQNLEIGKLKNTNSAKNNSPLINQKVSTIPKDTVKPKNKNSNISKNNLITSSAIENKGK